MKCHILDFESADHDALDKFADRTVFQTREWVRIVGENHKMHPQFLLSCGTMAGSWAISRG